MEYVRAWRPRSRTHAAEASEPLADARTCCIEQQPDDALVIGPAGRGLPGAARIMPGRAKLADAILAISNRRSTGPTNGGVRVGARSAGGGRNASSARSAAEENLDRAAPDDNLLNLLAGLQLKAEQYDEAEELYRSGARANPAADAWLRSLAKVYLAQAK